MIWLESARIDKTYFTLRSSVLCLKTLLKQVVSQFWEISALFVLFPCLNIAVLPSCKRIDLPSKPFADGDRPTTTGNGEGEPLKRRLQRAVMILTES